MTSLASSFRGVLAIPIVGYFWFKAAERFRKEMRERLDEMEERRGDDEEY